MKRKLFTFLLAVVASVCLTRAEIYSGTCGYNLTWSFNTEDSTLVIEGTGAMVNYRSSSTPVPWKDFLSKIYYLKLPNGLTTIGYSSFEGCNNLSSVTIPDGVLTIEAFAFYECSNLKYANIPESVKKIGYLSFAHCDLTFLIIPNSVTEIDYGAFHSCSSLTVAYPSSASLSNDVFRYCYNVAEYDQLVEDFAIFGNTVTLYYGDEQAIQIPKNIKTIGANAFLGKSTITSITIPNSVTSIGESAFQSCRGLTVLDIPNSVTSIGKNSFSGCSGLTSVSISENLTYLGEYAFSYCSKLTSVIVPAGLKNIGDRIFYNCSSLTSVSLPNGLTKIGESAFSNCSSLTSIDIPNSVINIDKYAFSNCSSLSLISIPENVTKIGYGAFSGCTSLPVINNIRYADTYLVAAVDKTLSTYEINEDTRFIGNEAFANCANMTHIIIPNSVTYVSENAFMGCTGLVSPIYNSHVFFKMPQTHIGEYAIPEGIETIASNAFDGCENIVSIVIPNSAKSIGIESFRNCISLETITIPENISEVLTCAFSGCTNIKSVVWQAKKCASPIPHVEWHETESGKISEYIYETESPFYNIRTQITSFDFGDQVEVIPDYLCYGMSKLVSVSLSANVTKIGEGVFSVCGSLPVIDNLRYADTYLVEAVDKTLSTYNIRESTKFIGNAAFRYCSNLTSITIPNNVASIDNYAFYYCKNLTTITIPQNVTSIGEQAFDYCSQLQSINVKGETPASIGESAFNHTNNCPIYIPCGTHSDYASAWSAYANRLKYEAMEFPYSLTCSVNIEGAGYVQKPTSVCDGMTITATAYNGYHFVKWSDGITDNPRTIELTKDTTFTAIFDFEKSGTCGKDLALAWKFNDDNKSLTISGNGELTTNYSYNIAAKYAQKVIINEGVTNIGESAFYNCSNLTTLTIPASVTNIARYAFYSCSNLATIYERSATPPSINYYSFINSNIDVYVPFGCKEQYKSADVWKNMTIHSPEITKDANAHATSCVISFAVESIVLQSCGIVDDDIFPGNVIELTGLEPETEYNKNIAVTANTGETETIEVSFTTTALELNTQPARLTSESSAVLIAYTNMADIETSCGFEFRRTGASDLVPSQMMNCAIANGTMAVKVNNIKAGVEYKYRPYYTSKQGNTKYGDWTAFDPIDAYIEYEPIVCTQTATGVTNSKATMRAMVVEGSSAISEQGFDVCAVGRQINNAQGAPRRAHKSVIGEHWTVPAEGTNMKVTLTDLDEGTTYTYRTYVIINGDTIFGSEQSFTTLGEYLYTVTFVDYDDTILGTDKVHYGDAATAPEDPIREGYEFTGWDNDFSNVTDDLTITATYSIATALPESTATQSKAQKLLHDGQLFIVLPDGTRYTATGMKVE